MPGSESSSATSTRMIRAARSRKEGRHHTPHECGRVFGLQNVVLDCKRKRVFGTMRQHVGGTASHLAHKPDWLAAVENTHLVCGQPGRVLAMLPIPDISRFPDGSVLLRSQVRYTEASCRNNRNKKKNVSLWVKKHGLAFPEVIEKN